MKKYNEVVAGNGKVEMVHISRDSEEDDAEDWAAKEQFPWLTILPGDVERSGLMEYRPGNGVPSYVLVSKDGERLATGSQAVFSKAAELSKGGDS